MAVQAAERALDAAQVLLEAGPSCRKFDRQMFVCRAYSLLASGSWQVGNLMESCRTQWIMLRIDRRVFSSGLTDADFRYHQVAPEDSAWSVGQARCNSFHLKHLQVLRKVPSQDDRALSCCLA